MKTDFWTFNYYFMFTSTLSRWFASTAIPSASWRLFIIISFPQIRLLSSSSPWNWKLWYAVFFYRHYRFVDTSKMSAFFFNDGKTLKLSVIWNWNLFLRKIDYNILNEAWDFIRSRIDVNCWYEIQKPIFCRKYKIIEIETTLQSKKLIIRWH